MKFSHKKTKNFNIFRRGKGFSLVEMSVVLLIIGILIAGISRGIDLYADFKIQTAQKLTINSPVSRIEGLALWLETTLEKSFQTKMVNNSEVPQWNNISPFDLNPKNAFNYFANKPTFLENNINGLPAIQFSNSSQNCMSVESGFDNNTENVTIFLALVMKSSNIFANGATIGRIIEKWSDPSKPYPYVLRPSFSFVTYYTGDNGSRGSYFAAEKIGFPYVVSARRVKLGNLSIWVNGVKGTDVLDNVATDTTNTSPLYIGCRGPGSAGAAGDFNVGEIIIYSRALSDAEISRVNQYLSQKWNIKF